jgi:HK97 gp10 family phage protein
MTAQIIGDDKHRKRLNGMAANSARDLLAALYAAGQLIEVEAEISITNGSISGKGHVPSLPGEPPNADTRHLDTNIETTIEARDPPTVVVTSHAAYSAALEFGTSRMAERPFMRPAVAKKRAEAIDLVKRAANRNIRHT